ncbi:MAG: cytochrome C, partial [Aquabacterium sp.]|nr:cytochrome C [Aquabacterium sp.]
LTPFGIKFKLGAYVDSDGKAGKIPLSAMVIAEYARFKEPDANGNNVSSSKLGLAESSVFLAGKLSDNIGSFVQVTNNGIEHTTGIDQADLRYATTVNVGGDKEALVGVSINNNPTVQDPFNTLSVWSFPYTATERAAGPGVDMVSASVEQRVIGVNAYSLINDNIYAELGLYNSISPAMQSRLGVGRYPEGAEFAGMSNAPYVRLAYMKDMRTQAWNVGLLAFNGKLEDRASADSVKFKDVGIDGSYQFLGTREHVVTVNGSYIREHTTANVSGVDEGNTVKNTKLAASYHFQNTYGATLGYFKATSEDQHAGNRGFIYQVDWTPWGKESSWAAPWANLRVGMQYIQFKRFVSYDEDNDISTVLAKPGDMNSLRLFAWTSF